MRSIIYVDDEKLVAAATASPSALLLDEIRRWSFNSMMEFKDKPARTPAEIQALYTPLLAEAWTLAQLYKAEQAALPMAYAVLGEEQGRAEHKRRQEIQRRSYAQSAHYYKLRQQYSYELAFSIWWNRVDAQQAQIKERQDAYRAAWEKEFADQKAFEEEQADKAIAELRAAQPHLSEALLARLHSRLCYRLHLFFRQHPRSEAPRRVMRGLPKVLCGSLPSEARLDYSGICRDIYHTAF
jgi:hypothetical protein